MLKRSAALWKWHQPHVVLNMTPSSANEMFQSLFKDQIHVENEIKKNTVITSRLQLHLNMI